MAGDKANGSPKVAQQATGRAGIRAATAVCEASFSLVHEVPTLNAVEPGEPMPDQKKKKKLMSVGPGLLLRQFDLPPGKWDGSAEGARPGGPRGPNRDAEKHAGSELGAHLASVTNPKLQR
jgi:hypothetical protein